MPHVKRSETQIVAAVAHELVKAERFVTVTDFSDAIKAKCAKLKLAYNSGIVSDAMRQVLHVNRGALGPVAGLRRAVERPDVAEGMQLSRADASRLYREVMRRLQTECPTEPIPERPAGFPDLMRVL